MPIDEDKKALVGERVGAELMWGALIEGLKTTFSTSTELHIDWRRNGAEPICLKLGYADWNVV